MTSTTGGGSVGGAASSNPVLNAEYVTFSGGGTRGFCFPAAVHAIEDFMLKYGHGHFLERIKGYGGASIGSLFAMLYAAGYTSRSLQEEIMSRNVNDVFVNANPLNFIDKWALDDGSKLEEWIEDLLERRFGKWARKITFAEFEREARKQLVVAVVIMPDNRPEYTEYVSAQNYPNKGVAHAVRISMALPGAISPVREPISGTFSAASASTASLATATTRLNGGVRSRETAIWTDGANLEILPFRIWGGKRTLGFLLIPEKTMPVRSAIDYFQRMFAIYSSRSSDYYMQSLSATERQCIVEVDAPSATIDLNTTAIDKQRMFDSAYASVQRYLSKFSDDVLRDAILTIAKWAACLTPATMPTASPLAPVTASPVAPLTTAMSASQMVEEQVAEEAAEHASEPGSTGLGSGLGSGNEPALVDATQP
jgi:hypothetical protein